MREFEFIKQIKKNITYKNAGVIKGIGDDCAIINFEHAKNKFLIVTADSLFEDVHFKKKYFKPLEIGARAMAVNISDICAMGGIPLYAIVSIGYPAKEKQDLINNLYKGIIEYGTNYGIEVVGGDIISADKIFISITLIGEVEKEKVLRRDTAKAGDIIFVTGVLGDSYSGLKILSRRKNNQIKDFEYIPIKRHILPVPRYIEGRMLAESDLLNSCIDVSDGIVNDVTRVAEESGLGAEIYAETLPVSPSAYCVAMKYRDDPLDYALYGGEDYELLFTVSAVNRNKILKFASENNLDISEIGKMTSNKAIYIIRKGKKIKETYKKAWRHF